MANSVFILKWPIPPRLKYFEWLKRYVVLGGKRKGSHWDWVLYKARVNKGKWSPDKIVMAKTLKRFQEI
jgi:hypothetical protein